MTSALSVRMVEVASGKVKVFRLVAGPLKAIKALPVPPLALGRIPVTPFVRFICAQAGLLLAPVLERYLVAFVSLAKADRVSAADPYIMSP